ncbi:hypothetical protein [Accumulibacter sp.]|uniref:hypothetical protein n=1 Tax=Accumulibacter sp. TaxID=2053492 RepID=UPI002637CF43|nr:hypothetical protein [Accumulibacter sp.]
MSISPFLIAALLVFVGWLWWVRRRDKTRTLSTAGPTTPQPYRCVAIRPGQEACPGVRSLAGRRFLVPAAPPLPLANCAVASCQCRYAHFADRRDDERRHSNALLRGLTPHTGNIDHRSGRDRRRSAAAGADARH